MSKTGSTSSSKTKCLIRRILRAYARCLPHHWKKEGLVHRASRMLLIGDQDEITDTLRCGCRVVLRMRDNFERRLFYFGTQERKSEDLWTRMVKGSSAVLDVGANIGIFTLLAAKGAGPSARILAFEPVPSTFAQLKKNVELNHSANVECLPAAAWDSVTRLRMACDDPLGHCGIYGVDVRGREGSEVEVDALTLDGVAEAHQLSKVDAIKLDIEGAELRALRGATGLLRRDKPKLLLEVDSGMMARFGYSPPDLGEYLCSMGYECYDVQEDNRAQPARSAPRAARLQQQSRGNFLFLPRGVSLDG